MPVVISAFIHEPHSGCFCTSKVCTSKGFRPSNHIQAVFVPLRYTLQRAEGLKPFEVHTLVVQKHPECGLCMNAEITTGICSTNKQVV